MNAVLHDLRRDPLSWPLFFVPVLRHRVQEFNSANARVQAGMPSLATIALLIPSAAGRIDQPNAPSFSEVFVGSVQEAALTLGMSRSPAPPGTSGCSCSRCTRSSPSRFTCCPASSGGSALRRHTP